MKIRGETLEFYLTLDKPKNELSGFTAHSATLIWENGHGNDCREGFHKRDHVELMREVLSFLKNKGHQIVALDVSDLERNRVMVFHTS